MKNVLDYKDLFKQYTISNNLKYDLLVKWAIDCIKTEAKAYPSLGLVSEVDNGSHTDMNFEMFMKSSETFKYYFLDIIDLVNTDDDFSFLKLRNLGKIQEKRMYKATNGINTHKGLIFAFGIVFYISIYAIRNELAFNSWSDLTKTFVLDLHKDFKSVIKCTKGLQIYSKYNIKGARGLALEGYQIVYNEGLAFLKKYKQRYPNLSNENFILILLIFYLSEIDDTTLISKIGYDKSLEIKNQAKEWIDILENQGWIFFYKKMLSINHELQQKNISPGGCADLTIITMFLDKLSNMKG